MAFNELLDRQKREEEELKISLEKYCERLNSGRAFAASEWNDDWTSTTDYSVAWNPMWTTTTTTTNTF